MTCSFLISSLRPTHRRENLAIVERIRTSLKTIIWRRHARREAEDENISESMLEDASKKICLGRALPKRHPWRKRAGARFRRGRARPCRPVSKKRFMLSRDNICTGPEKVGPNVY